MKCNQFCLCRVRHVVVNYCKFSILGRENNYFLCMQNSKIVDTSVLQHYMGDKQNQTLNA